MWGRWWVGKSSHTELMDMIRDDSEDDDEWTISTVAVNAVDNACFELL